MSFLKRILAGFWRAGYHEWVFCFLVALAGTLVIVGAVALLDWAVN